VESVAFSPDGTLLASGSDDSTVKLWDVTTGTLVRTLEGHSDTVHAVAFSPDGALLASGSWDYTVRLWNVASGSLVRTLEGHDDLVDDVAFSPDGELLASGSADYTVRIWDVGTGSSVHTLQGHADLVHSVSFSPDGAALASASWDNTVKLWDVATGTALQTLRGHTTDVESVDFSPCGAYLLSGADDNRIKVWDVATGAELASFGNQSDYVWAIVVSPDGKSVASAAGDGTVALWNIEDVVPPCTPTVLCPQYILAAPAFTGAEHAPQSLGCISASEWTQFLGLATTGSVDISVSLSGESDASSVATFSLAPGTAITLAAPILTAGTWHFTATNRLPGPQTCSVVAMSFPILTDLLPLRYCAHGQVADLPIELFNNLLRTNRGALDVSQYYVEVSDDPTSLEVTMVSSGPATVYLRYGSPVEVADGIIVADAFARTTGNVATFSVTGTFLKPGMYYIGVEAASKPTIYDLSIALGAESQ
jgi:WD40 repeat protein